MLAARRAVASYATRNMPKAFTPQWNFSRPQQRQVLTNIQRSFIASSIPLKFTPKPSQFNFAAISPSTTSPFALQRRRMGIGDFFSEKIENKKNEMQGHKERESYRHLRDFLISCPRFRFKENLAYVEALQAQIGKTDRIVGGQDIKVQEEMMKKKIQVFKSMTPLELLHESPGAINMAIKSRISLATGLDRKAIEGDLKQFDELKTMHTWLQARLKSGKSLPENTVEMQKLMMEDPPPPSWQQLKMVQKARASSRRSRH